MLLMFPLPTRLAKRHGWLPCTSLELCVTIPRLVRIRLVTLAPPTISRLDCAMFGFFPWGTPLFLLAVTIQTAVLVRLGSNAVDRPLLLDLMKTTLMLGRDTVTVLYVLRPTE